MTIKSYKDRPKIKRLLASGLCMECGLQPLATLTLCNQCADRHKRITRERRSNQQRETLRKRRDSYRYQEENIDYSYVQMAER